MTVVCFDGDDTLWAFAPVLRAALGASLQELRRRVPAGGADGVTLERLAALREAAAERHGEELGFRELRRLSFAALLEELGVPDDELCDALCAVFNDARSALIEPYPDVVPALDALAGRYTLGLLSNGNADVERCALRGRFAFRVHAEQHGVAKPDPRLFEVALREAGCAPQQMVHVGDSLVTDVAGARAAGVHAVWLNRGGDPRPAGEAEAGPDAEIASLAELPALLEALPA